MKSKKYNSKQDILFLLITSFIVVVAWIGFNLYHIWVTSTISEDVQMQLTPINPSFDQKTIQQLKTREDINPLYTSLQTPSGSSSAEQNTPTPSTLPTEAASSGNASQSASENASQSASTTSPISRLGQ